MLSDDACKEIKDQSQREEYTWKDANGLDEEMDGMTITACHVRSRHLLLRLGSDGIVWLNQQRISIIGNLGALVC